MGARWAGWKPAPRCGGVLLWLAELDESRAGAAGGLGAEAAGVVGGEAGLEIVVGFGGRVGVDDGAEGGDGGVGGKGRGEDVAAGGEFFDVVQGSLSFGEVE